MAIKSVLLIDAENKMLKDILSHSMSKLALGFVLKIETSNKRVK